MRGLGGAASLGLAAGDLLQLRSRPPHHLVAHAGPVDDALDHPGGEGRLGSRLLIAVLCDVGFHLLRPPGEALAVLLDPFEELHLRHGELPVFLLEASVRGDHHVLQEPDQDLAPLRAHAQVVEVRLGGEDVLQCPVGPFLFLDHVEEAVERRAHHDLIGFLHLLFFVVLMDDRLEGEVVAEGGSAGHSQDRGCENQAQEELFHREPFASSFVGGEEGFSEVFLTRSD